MLINIFDRTGRGIAAAGAFIPANSSMLFAFDKAKPYAAQLEGLAAKGAIQVCTVFQVGSTDDNDATSVEVPADQIAELFLTPDTLRAYRSVMYIGLQARGTLIHQLGASAGGVVYAAGFGGAQPNCPRNVECVHTGAFTLTAYTITIHGTDIFGATIQESVEIDGADTYIMSKAFAYISSIVQVGTIEIGDTLDVNIGNRIGMPFPVLEESFSLIRVNGVIGGAVWTGNFDVDEDNGTITKHTGDISGSDKYEMFAAPDWNR